MKSVPNYKTMWKSALTMAALACFAMGCPDDNNVNGDTGDDLTEANCVATDDRVEGCYWLSNEFTDTQCWVTDNDLLGKDLSEAECDDEGADCSSGGGCYEYVKVGGGGSDMGMMDEDSGEDLDMGGSSDDGGTVEQDMGADASTDTDLGQDQGMDAGGVDMGDMDEADGGADMDPVDMGPADMTPDMGPADMGMDMPADDMAPDMVPDMSGGGTVAEVEPNDDPDTHTLQSVTPGQTITGMLELFDPSDATSEIDVDTFRFSLNEGDIFEWSIQNLGAGFATSGLFTVLVSENTTIESERYLDSDYTTTTRQTLIPETGDYLLIVVSNDSTGGMHGGPTSTYEIATSYGVPAMASAAPLAVTIPGDFDDGQLDYYSFTWSGNNDLFAEVTAGRAPVSSDFDPVLFVLDASTGQIVAFNDDIDVNASNYDSALTASLVNGNTYYVVVDGWDIFGDTSYTLDLLQSMAP